MVFLEDRLKLGILNADAGVADLDAEAARSAPATEEDLAGAGVFERVGDHVAQHLFQHSGVAVHHEPAGDHAELEPLRLRVIGEFVPQPVEQFVEPEIDRRGAYRAGLDLVDVEQGVQHAGHGAQRLVEPAHEALGALALDMFFEQAVEQGQGLQRLAQIVTRRGEEPGFGGVGQIRLLAGRFERLRRALPFGDLREGDDHALDPVVLRPIRQDVAQEPGAAFRLDLAFDRQGRFQNVSRVGQQFAVGDQRIQVGERPSDVARNDAEQRFRGRREQPDTQFLVEE
jgi:hypothetical protein